MPYYKKHLFAGIIVASTISLNAGAKINEGFYVGISGGVDRNYSYRHEVSLSSSVLPAFTVSNKDFSENCASFGVRVGLLKAIKKESKWMYGLELFANKHSLRRTVDALQNVLLMTANFFATLSERHSFGACAKFGRVVSEKYFVYGLLGAGASRHNYSFTRVSFLAGRYDDSSSFYMPFIKYGLGVSCAVTDRVAVSIEATLSKFVSTKQVELLRTVTVLPEISVSRNKAAISVGLNYSF